MEMKHTAECDCEGYDGIAHDMLILQKQRDELLAALEEAADCIDMLGKNCVDRIWDGERWAKVLIKEI